MGRSFLYHVFISHVFEDKDEIADQLNEALRAAGFKVWYSGTDLRIGDDLTQTIHEILPQCKYAIVIISPDYLKSGWAAQELKMLASLEVPGRKIILPIWHHVSSKDLRHELPFHTDRFAVSSAKGMNVILPRLIAEIKKPTRLTTKSSATKKDPEESKSSATTTYTDVGMIIKGNVDIKVGNDLIGRDRNSEKRSTKE